MYLFAGVAYPIEIFYVNRGAAGGMDFQYTDPNGVTRRSFDGFVYHLSSEAVCNYVEKHVVTMEWDQSTTSHSSTSSTDILTQTNSYLTDRPITYTGTVIKETEIVYVPIPTVTTYWTGLDTSTSEHRNKLPLNYGLVLILILPMEAQLLQTQQVIPSHPQL